MKKLIFLLMVVCFLILYQPVLGDVNRNGIADGSDCNMIKNHILKIKELNTDQMIRADVNKDGKINSTDIAWIRYFMK